jgi:hypothetical protein
MYNSFPKEYEPPMHALRAILSSLVLLALLLGGAVPSGFMPGKKDGGSLTIEICTASGWSTAEVPAHDGHEGEEKRDACPYAPVLAHAFVPAAQPAAFALPSSFIPPATAQIPVRAAPKHWHAQGPPFLS